ncbi:MAG: site-specific integrase [Alphaproteobacteria bacterium]|nr:site-specific integrase [Alphaproteobacteria bacterium]
MALYLEGGGERRYLQPLIDRFGTTPLSRIDQGAIDRAARELKPAASAATRARQVYMPIGAVLHYAAKRGLCEYRKIERPRQPKGRMRWLRPDEAERLIEACAPHLRPLVILLFGTGARLSEALYLDWKHVDLAARRVRFMECKNGEPRGVPLNERVVIELANLDHRDGAVFRRPDGAPYARRAGVSGQIKTAFKGACRRAGIADFTPHDCRHTWASWFYAETRDIRALMELGGWKSMKMVERYTHLNPDHLAAAIDRLPWAKDVQRQSQSA